MSHTAPRRLGVALTAATMSVAAVVGTSPAASAKSADPWWFSALHLADAHTKTTGKGVTVAVIDTAVDTNVPDLKGADIEFGAACEPHDAKSRPRIHDVAANHGTAMTTIIAGQGKGNASGGAGITGVAPDATIRFYNSDPDPRQTKKDCDELDTVSLFQQAIRDGVDAGIVVVAGAGEPDEAISSPASIPGVVSVLAVDKNAQPWKHNPHMQPTNAAKNWKFGFPVISAPGVEVPAGAMDKAGAWTSAYPRTGTSDATALVSGLLALVKSAHPQATGNQLVQHVIHYTSDEKLDWDVRYGFGIASVSKMLRHDPTTWPDVNPLLKGPDQAIADFPAGGDTPKTSTPTPESDKSPASAAATSDEGGTPGWLLPAVGVGALAMIAAAAVARRRHTTDSHRTSRDTAEEAGS